MDRAIDFLSFGDASDPDSQLLLHARADAGCSIGVDGFLGGRLAQFLGESIEFLLCHGDIFAGQSISKLASLSFQNALTTLITSPMLFVLTNTFL